MEDRCLGEDSHRDLKSRLALPKILFWFFLRLPSPSPPKQAEGYVNFVTISPRSQGYLFNISRSARPKSIFAPHSGHWFVQCDNTLASSDWTKIVLRRFEFEVAGAPQACRA